MPANGRVSPQASTLEIPRTLESAFVRLARLQPRELARVRKDPGAAAAAASAAEMLSMEN